jgi:hypothetical protein
MSSKLVSNFELLVQPIIPPAFAPPGIENPLVVQAYFLTVSNYNSTDTPGPAPQIKLRFVTNGLSSPNIPVSFLDRSSAIKIPIAVSVPGFVLESTISVAPTDTAVFLLQPDLATIFAGGQPFNAELRGYVTIEAPAGTSLLLSPQTRGTFYRGPFGDLTVASEESTSLPTAEGALYVF